MDNELLNGIILSYSKLLKEIDSLKRDVKDLSRQMIHNHDNSSQKLLTPTSQPSPVKKRQYKRKVPTKKKIPPSQLSLRPTESLMKELEDEI